MASDSLPSSTAVPSGKKNLPVRVLVIDDDDSIRRLLKSVLTQAGCLVETASHGRHGLQLLLAKTFDVAVVDVRMHEMDGLAFIQESIKIWPWQGFVILSGYIDDEVLKVASQAGISHILNKPLDTKLLQEAVFDEALRQEHRVVSTSHQMPLTLISYQLNMMRHITRTILHSQNLLSGLTQLGEAIHEMLPYHMMGILVVEEHEQFLLMQSMESPSTTVMQHLQQYILDRYQALSGRHLDADELRVERTGPLALMDHGRELKSISSVPIMNGDQIRGIMTFGAYEADAFNEFNIALLYHAASDLSTLFSALYEMRLQATRDALTGLYNRRQLDEEIDRAWHLSRRHRQWLAVIMVDLDRFKEINDQLGHAMGDQVLKAFSETLKSNIRTTDILARYGGDEFVIILSQTSIQEAGILTERLLSGIRRACLIPGRDAGSVTASIGIAMYNPNEILSDQSVLLKRADQALYRAKADGRNRHFFWTDIDRKLIEQAEPYTKGDRNEPQLAPRVKGHLLVLDDEEYVLLVLKRILEADHYHVTTLKTISEALAALREKKNTFDFLLCDLSLPDGDGMEMLRWSREIDSDIITIVISGQVTADNAIAALREGAYDFIQKPIVADSLIALLNRALQYRNLIRENVRYRNHLEDMVKSNKAELNIALEDIKRAYEFTLETMVAMLDARESETGQHSLRVRDLTLLLARKMGLADEQLAEIGRGALLHDIGKIGIPDTILLKPGPLNPDEWAVMRKHPEIGYRFMKNSPFLHTAAGVVLSHHERWDGTGYPQQLKGEAIDIGARIFSVIDAYDTMRSSRVYKKPLMQVDAVAEIKTQTDKQFDPAVVKVFLTCLPEIEQLGRWSVSCA